MPHYQLSAYKHTGKDSLFAACQQNQLAWYAPFELNQTEFWHVYALPTTDALMALFPLLNSYCEHVVRLSFGDRVKKEVHALKGLPPPEEMDDAVKDSLVIDGKILREHYKDYGAKKRAEDPLYFVKPVMMWRAEMAWRMPRLVSVVTDCRYDNETPRDYPFISIRLYRSAVEVPNDDDVSERSIDQCTHQLLLVGPGDADIVKSRLPQYSQYVLKGGLDFVTWRAWKNPQHGCW